MLFKLLALSVNNITRKKTSMKFNIKKVAAAFLSVAMAHHRLGSAFCFCTADA